MRRSPWALFGSRPTRRTEPPLSSAAAITSSGRPIGSDGQARRRDALLTGNSEPQVTACELAEHNAQARLLRHRDGQIEVGRLCTGDSTVTTGTRTRRRVRRARALTRIES